MPKLRVKKEDTVYSVRGEALRKAIKDTELSQNAFAKECGVHASYITELVNKDRVNLKASSAVFVTLQTHGIDLIGGWEE